MKNIFKEYGIAIIIAILLILGNIWCYAENDRLLKPMTNIVTIGFIVFHLYASKTKK